LLSSTTPRRAYNDMLYLCEKYGPLDSLEKYDPAKDVAINRMHVPFVINQLQRRR
jgi:protein-ribulosamine 3-kinase